MKMRAAIAWKQNRPLEIEEDDLDGSNRGEVQKHSQPQATMLTNSLPIEIIEA